LLEPSAAKQVNPFARIGQLHFHDGPGRLAGSSSPFTKREGKGGSRWSPDPTNHLPRSRSKMVWTSSRLDGYWSELKQAGAETIMANIP
jgi:hypothetical protein